MKIFSIIFYLSLQWKKNYSFSSKTPTQKQNHTIVPQKIQNNK